MKDTGDIFESYSSIISRKGMLTIASDAYIKLLAAGGNIQEQFPALFQFK